MSALEREAVAGPRPSIPYRGIEEFRFVDEPIFFGRGDELRVLTRLVTMYRGALLFGDSGAGKSSLINAGLLPDLVRDQYAAERIRVQPVPGGEFIVERIPVTDNAEGPFLSSLFAGIAPGRHRITVSSEQFAKTMDEARSSEVCTLLVFDQFEEFVTLTEQALRDRQARVAVEKARNAISQTLMSLLRKSELNLKILFVFREDYYAKLSRFFAQYPNLGDHFFRLEPLRTDDLPAMIRGPFEQSELGFERPLPAQVMSGLEQEFRERSATDFVSLSEVQIACLRLWRAQNPTGLLASEHVNGLLEGYFSEATNSIRSSLRTASLAILGRLVTSSGTRNVVSFDTLMADMADDKIDRPSAEEALKALEETARVVRKEARNEVVIYELVSEYLVPWIRRQRIEARVGEREKKWMRAFAISCILAIVIALTAGLTLYRRSNTQLNKRLKEAEQIADAASTEVDALRKENLRLLHYSASKSRSIQSAGQEIRQLIGTITPLIADDDARIRELTREIRTYEAIIAHSEPTSPIVENAMRTNEENRQKIDGLKAERTRLQNVVDEAQQTIEAMSSDR